MGDYEQRVANERKAYDEQIEVHDLPAIATYWSERYIRPMVEEFGFVQAEQLFANYLRVADEAADGPAVFLSVGAGNCDTEVRTAQLLRAKGLTNFVIECLELNPRMLERGFAMAAESGVSDHLAFVEGDFNRWTAGTRYKAVIANQVLHHVVELEHLLSELKRTLHPAGMLLTGDMIGRNGHQRWPEALIEMQRFWRELPLEYRWNRLLNRYEEEFVNHDCSDAGFEGIRAQDVLPLLLEYFDFHLFVPFGNIIDPFVDRCFGPNFDAEGKWDRDFIERVHSFDERAILSGVLTPTHMYAALTPTPCREHLYSRGLSPERCVRRDRPEPVMSSSRLRIATPVLQPSQPGGAIYSMNVRAAGGAPPYVWSATGLPPGLEVSRQGELSGTLEHDGEFTPLITVTDASRPAQAIAQRYTIFERRRPVALPLTIVRSGELRHATVGVKYAEALLGCGGRPPLIWSLAAGFLPQGLNLDPGSGLISGEPLATSESAFTVRVVDSAGHAVTSDLRLRAKPPERVFARAGVFSHLTCETAWETVITLLNPSSRPASVSIDLRSSSGRHLHGFLVPSAPRHTCHETGQYILSAHSSLKIQLVQNQAGLDESSEVPSWARIAADADVAGFASFTYTSPEGIRSEVAVPLHQSGYAELSVPFDNQGGNRTGLALLNLSHDRSDAVAVSIWDEAGKFCETSSIPLPGNRHTAFMVCDRFADTAGRRGMLGLKTFSGGPLFTTCLCIRESGIPLFLPAIPSPGPNAVAISELDL